uniref:Uncharacterized protein n=1 Tax=Anguilla anguilla TaxID=7936 RepID=A0A0E9VMB5_ANGAN
MNRTILPARCL